MGRGYQSDFSEFCLSVGARQKQMNETDKAERNHVMKNMIISKMIWNFLKMDSVKVINKTVLSLFFF